MTLMRENSKVEVFVEGLLVQSRDLEDVKKWAHGRTTYHFTNTICDEIGESFSIHSKSTKQWLYSFKDYNGYVTVVPLKNDPHSCQVKVSFNDTSPNKPTLIVSAMFPVNKTSMQLFDVAAIAALGIYYLQ